MSRDSTWCLPRLKRRLEEVIDRPTTLTYEYRRSAWLQKTLFLSIVFCFQYWRPELDGLVWWGPAAGSGHAAQRAGRVERGGIEGPHRCSVSNGSLYAWVRHCLGQKYYESCKYLLKAFRFLFVWKVVRSFKYLIWSLSTFRIVSSVILGIMKISCCFVMAVIEDITRIVSDPRWKIFRKETGECKRNFLMWPRPVTKSRLDSLCRWPK